MAFDITGGITIADVRDPSDPINNATVNIYNRTTSEVAPTVPLDDARFTFSTDTLGFRVRGGTAPGDQLVSGTTGAGSFFNNADGQLQLDVTLPGDRSGDQLILVVTASGDSGLATGNYFITIQRDGAGENFFNGKSC